MITKTWSQKFINRARGVKYYRAGMTYQGLGRMSRRKFRTATEASAYGLRLKLRVGRMAGEQ